MAQPKIAYEKHPVTPERKAELRDQGFRIIDIRFKPKNAKAAPKPKAASIEATAVEAASVTPGNLAINDGAEPPTDEAPDDGYPTDGFMRTFIEDKTGSAPHHRTGRAKLIEMYNEANV